MDDKNSVRLNTMGDNQMVIVQDAFYISDDIMIKILTGEYRRIGDVIRHAIGPKKGRLVKFLNPIQNEPVQQVHFGFKAIQFAKDNKKTLIIAGIGSGIVAAGVGIYVRIKNRESEVVMLFRTSLRMYINGIQEGNLSIDLIPINDLMTCLEKLKNQKDYDKISVQLSTEELDILVNCIFEYTEKLAYDNSIELIEDELNSKILTGSIINLQRYLKTQKRIFETAS